MKDKEPNTATEPNKNETKTAKNRSGAFKYLVNDILKHPENTEEAFGIDEAALTALEEAAEEFLIKEFQVAGGFAAKNGCKTLRAEDMKAARVWIEHGQGEEAEPADGDQNMAEIILEKERKMEISIR
ncbi:hypothetical protein QTJ16_006945 [Diplocarpon rosae]|uniref:Histone H2A/H2B/H3 domain-containing protein n=1 Tax=Diplocarpon rosae TaxID=946125 RepID=A0AAD9WCG0_9HELO|nr:hypothetical protein QTJ16_006945 [Diplocarpon rosae]